jgi:hypothetical protein
MRFDTEPVGYEKSILSELQAAWQSLRDALAENPGFDDWERALLHVDEAMSWESVRNLRYMRGWLNLVRDILQRADAPAEVIECLEAVNELMDEALAALASGESR